MRSYFELNGRPIGPGERTFVVAEIGVNHDGSLSRAEELVDHAAEAGADAVKFQLFSAERLMHVSAHFAEYQSQRCEDADPAAMLRRYELLPLEVAHLVNRVRERDLVPLATPFSPEDVRTIEHLKLPAIKIASPDLVNRPLIDAAAALRRPVLVSTGAATMSEVEVCGEWLDDHAVPFALMHCVSAYPTPAAQANLAWIGQLVDRFGVPVGFSDHTTELLSGAFAVSAGACIVERHLTYDKTAEGPDHAASSDPREFADYVRLIRQAERMRGGRSGKCVLPIERDVRTVSRQSLVLRCDLRAGDVIDPSHLIVQRPGTGISAGEIARAVGKRARRSMRSGTILQWDMLSDAA